MSCLDDELRKLSEKDIVTLREVCKPSSTGGNVHHNDHPEEENGNCSFSAYNRFYEMQLRTSEKGSVQPGKENYVQVEGHSGYQTRQQESCDKGIDCGFRSDVTPDFLDLECENLFDIGDRQESTEVWGHDVATMTSQGDNGSYWAQDYQKVSYDRQNSSAHSIGDVIWNAKEGTFSNTERFQLSTVGQLASSDQCSLSVALEENFRTVPGNDFSCVVAGSLSEVSDRFIVPLECPNERVCDI